MASAIYEVLVRGNSSGEIAGAHVIYFEPDGYDREGNPRFTTTLPMPLHLAEVDGKLTSGLYGVGAQVTRLIADLDAARDEINRLKDQIARAERDKLKAQTPA